MKISFQIPCRSHGNYKISVFSGFNLRYSCTKFELTLSFTHGISPSMLPKILVVNLSQRYQKTQTMFANIFSSVLTYYLCPVTPVKREIPVCSSSSERQSRQLCGRVHFSHIQNLTLFTMWWISYRPALS